MQNLVLNVFFMCFQSVLFVLLKLIFMHYYNIAFELGEVDSTKLSLYFVPN